MKNPKPPIELKRLFGQTWNPEIIISTFGVIAILQALPYIGSILNQIFSDFGFFGESLYVKNGLIIPFYVILISFMAHIILRSYWLGLVGLHYAYPILNYDTINEESREISSIAEKKLNLYNEKSIAITRLDKICSSVFSWTFVSIFIFLGLVSLLISFTLLGYFIPSFGIRFYLAAFFFLCYAIPVPLIISFDKLISSIIYVFRIKSPQRKSHIWHTYVEKIILLLVSTFELLTFQFIYSSLKNRVIIVLGEFYFKMLFPLMIMLISTLSLLPLLVFIDLENVNKTAYKVVPSYKYENLRNHDFNYSTISINSDIIDDFLKIKVPLMRVGTKFLFSENSQDITNLLNAYISNIQLKINDSILISPKPFLNKEQTLIFSSYVLYYIDVRKLPKGLNNLIITFPTSRNSVLEISDTTKLKSEVIPFWVH